MNNKRPFHNLLIVMTDRHIGNLLVSLYAIKRVNQQLNTGQTLACVIDSNLLSLAEYLLPEVEFIPYSLRGRKNSPIKKLSLLGKLLFKLRKRKIDTAVDLYGHGESYYIARLSGASYISCFYSRPKLKAKYQWSDLDSGLQPEHQIDYYLYPFIPLFGTMKAAVIDAPRDEKTLVTVNEKLTQLNISTDKPLAVIHPGAGKDYKLWPIGHWQQLIKKLQKNHCQVLLIGAGDDLQQIQAIISNSDISPINGFQRFNLIETIHLGFIAQLMLGNDSGPTHLMATTPTAVFSLFGPTDHKLWSPLSPNSRILRADGDCLESCSKQNCRKEVSCLEALSPDYVFTQTLGNMPGIIKHE